MNDKVPRVPTIRDICFIVIAIAETGIQWSMLYNNDNKFYLFIHLSIYSFIIFFKIIINAITNLNRIEKRKRYLEGETMKLMMKKREGTFFLNQTLVFIPPSWQTHSEHEKESTEEKRLIYSPTLAQIQKSLPSNHSLSLGESTCIFFNWPFCPRSHSP